MSNILVGTCSWNYDSWIGLVYAGRQRTAAEYLPEYARKYKTAEIDSWFYKLPSKNEARSYRDNTPDDFIFTCKVLQDITLTHARSFDKSKPLAVNKNFLSVELFNRYCEAIEPLLDKIGVIMFEFEYLNKEKMESVGSFIDMFGAFKSKISKQYKIGVEIRNKNYLTEDYFRFIQEHDLIHVFSEKQFMPPVYEVYEKFGRYIGDTSVLRLLGNSRSDIEKLTNEQWNKIVDEKNKEDIVKLSIDLKFRGGTIIINVNNHYEGSAPLTIEAFKDLFDRHGVLV